MRAGHVWDGRAVLPPLRKVLALLVIIASGHLGAAAEEPAVVAPPSGPQTVTVEVEGVGKDADEARHDAYRMAVRQVLGSLVDSKTLVENDQLITDRVVVFSNGFVENVEPVPNGEIRESNGLIRIRLRASVQAGKLDESLRNNGITPSGSKVLVDNPRAQLASIVSEQDRKKNAREMFLALADGYPANCFTAAVGQPKILEVNDGVAKCEVRVSISVKEKEYEEFASRLITFLESGPVELQGDYQLFGSGRIDDCSSELLGSSNNYVQSTNPRSGALINTPKWRSIGADIGQQYIHDYKAPGSLTGQKAGDFVRVTGKKNTIWISVYSGAEQAFKCRWFGIDHTAVSYPTVLPEFMRCSVMLGERGGDCAETVLTLDNVGYSRAGWDNFYFVPGYRSETHDKNPVGPTFEFVAILAVPEAVFDKPGLTIEATLSNVPVEPTKPAHVPAEPPER